MAPITAVCFSYPNCFVRSLALPLPLTPVHWRSVQQCRLTLLILPLGEAQLEANWRFYLVERCTIEVETFYVNPGFSQKDQKLMCIRWYGAGLIFSHATFLGVGFISD